jgi:ferredoxin
MMDAARAALEARGVGLERIREERFHSPSEARAPLLEAPVMARMRVGGRDHVVRVDPGQTLLEAGLAAGAELPFSCAMGGCGACKVKLVSGTVHTEEPSCLSPRERAEGYVLTCCSRPTSPVALEVLEERSGVSR